MPYLFLTNNSEAHYRDQKTKARKERYIVQGASQGHNLTLKLVLFLPNHCEQGAEAELSAGVCAWPSHALLSPGRLRETYPGQHKPNEDFYLDLLKPPLSPSSPKCLF